MSTNQNTTEDCYRGMEEYFKEGGKPEPLAEFLRTRIHALRTKKSKTETSISGRDSEAGSGYQGTRNYGCVDEQGHQGSSVQWPESAGE